MSNWLTTLGPYLTGGIKLAGGAAAGAAGGPLAGAAMSLGGPLAASLLQAIVAAEKHHLEKVAAAGSAPVTDTRLEHATSAMKAAMPLIEALAAATGHPIPNVPEFEASLPETITNMVTAIKSLGKTLDSLGVKL